VLLAAGGWAANQAYMRIFVVEESYEQGETLVTPDGSVTFTFTSRKVVVVSDDPKLTEEDAHRQWAQTKQAIDQGNYSLLQQRETETGQPVYIYRVVVEDGSTEIYGTNEPLRDAPRFEELIRRAIDQGSYTLVRERESESGQPLYVYRLALEDGTTHRYGTGEPLEDDQRPESPAKLVVDLDNYALVEVREFRGRPLYLYETVLDDGTKRRFHTNVPLSEPNDG
jgi:hypothetical protein